ncbi:NUDIX hydrolase [Geitlerinema sp. PCC 9228]|jgi:ADP-ribose pyrophosphatase|uniref:NUDIX hydrolase n=1 Tax=Geitlerinema sp. PCC 9228 TaxID=111611 RepID=UPI0008F99737|nr:NUDIX hydrolase [Geitlerinema sp. PCC 9228]
MGLGQEISEVLGSRLSYQGRKFRFVVEKLRLPKGTQAEFEYIKHPGGALCVPVTNDGKLILVRQYRFSVCDRLLEFPAGTVEPHEDPEATIRREIEEETGYRAHQWQKLGEFSLAPGYSSEMIYAFLAKDLEPLDTPPEQDVDEDIEVVTLSAEELKAAILAGEPVDSKSISSFFLAQDFL